MSDHGIRKRVDIAMEALQKVKQINDSMQRGVESGSTQWRAHEEIDNHLHDAIKAIDYD